MQGEVGRGLSFQPPTNSPLHKGGESQAEPLLQSTSGTAKALTAQGRRCRPATSSIQKTQKTREISEI